MFTYTYKTKKKLEQLVPKQESLHLHVRIHLQYRSIFLRNLTQRNAINRNSSVFLFVESVYLKFGFGGSSEILFSEIQ